MLKEKTMETNKVEHRLMTGEEKLLTMYNAVMLFDEGKDEEAVRLVKTVPLKPGLAMVGKEVYGPAFLLENGYNLLEADTVYGKNWLYK
jgi:hypothetical protein